MVAHLFRVLCQQMSQIASSLLRVHLGREDVESREVASGELSNRYSVNDKEHKRWLHEIAAPTGMPV